jgi:hypothetical protein
MLPLGLNGDFGMSPSYGQTRREALAMALLSRNDHKNVVLALCGSRNSCQWRRTCYFLDNQPAPLILLVRRLVSVARDCSEPSRKINIVSTAAMHTPLPLGVKSTHYRAAQHCCPFRPNKQTPTGRVQCDAVCQKRTHAPQQKLHHSITSSAMASTPGGTSMPSDRAV